MNLSKISVSRKNHNSDNSGGGNLVLKKEKQRLCMPGMLAKSSHHIKKTTPPLFLSLFKNILHSGLSFESNTQQGQLVPLWKLWYVQDHQIFFSLLNTVYPARLYSGKQCAIKIALFQTVNVSRPCYIC